MTLVSNDPIWWSTIDIYITSSYVAVAALSIVVYDWALTFGQELELVWGHRWSLVTVLYLSVRYIGIPYSVFGVIASIPSIALTDALAYFIGSVLFNMTTFMFSLVNILLGAIMITCLHAIYQRSRKMLAFLVVIFVAVQVACGLIVVVENRNISMEEAILSGSHICFTPEDGGTVFLFEVSWILGAAWAVLALCLVVWIVIVHFRDLQRPSTPAALAIWDCLMALVKAHIFFFASCVLQLSYFSEALWNPESRGADIFSGVLQITTIVQTFMLGPCLILNMREYYAKLVVNSDDGIDMTSIVFRGRSYISADSPLVISRL